jgi:hypothetical protein
VQQTEKPDSGGWTIFHAEGPTWLLLTALVASVVTVVVLVIVLGHS